ncbi:HTH-type transcriptional regulator PrtR [compost metagenome]
MNMQVCINTPVENPDSLETLAQRLRFARKKRGISQDALAEISGVKQPDISKIERGSVLKPTSLLQLARALKINAYWLDVGDGEWESQTAPAHVAKAMQETPGDAITVPLLSVRASMGAGEISHIEDVMVGALQLSKTWVHESIRKLSKPDNLRFINAYGDSMFPTFSSGDVLLVDGGVKTVDVDGIFVLQAQDRLFIKRVRQRLGGGYEISSDNPNVKTVDVLDGGHSVEVLGRVVWVWNGRKL